MINNYQCWGKNGKRIYCIEGITILYDLAQNNFLERWRCVQVSDE